MADTKNTPPQEELKFNLNPDSTPVLYTDNVFMSVNDEGVVLDFCQRVGNSNQMQVVSRIYLTKNHAKRLIKLFEDLVDMSEGQLQTGKVGRS